MSIGTFVTNTPRRLMETQRLLEIRRLLEVLRCYRNRLRVFPRKVFCHFVAFCHTTGIVHNVTINVNDMDCSTLFTKLDHFSEGMSPSCTFYQMSLASCYYY